MPEKYSTRQGFLPIASMRYAALKYPGSCARHMMTVNSKLLTMSNPRSVSSEGVHRTNP